MSEYIPTAAEIERLARRLCRIDGYNPDDVKIFGHQGLYRYPAWQCYYDEANRQLQRYGSGES